MLSEKHKIEDVNVFYDLFQYDKQRLRNLAAFVEEHGLDLKLIIQAHAPTFDEETAQLLKRIGVVYCGFGLEASMPRMLRFLKCGVATVEDNRRAVRLAHRLGMRAGSGFLTGVPGQTKEDLDANEEFAREERLDAYRPYILCAYPGTPLWDYALAEGLVSPDMDFSRIYQMENRRNIVLGNIPE